MTHLGHKTSAIIPERNEHVPATGGSLKTSNPLPHEPTELRRRILCLGVAEISSNPGGGLSESKTPGVSEPTNFTLETTGVAITGLQSGYKVATAPSNEIALKSWPPGKLSNLPHKLSRTKLDTICRGIMGSRHA